MSIIISPARYPDCNTPDVYPASRKIAVYLLTLVPDGEWQHITFTVPCEFWPLIYHNRWLLAEMCSLAADFVLETGRRAGFLSGYFAVIHTWGRDQQWHSHIHLSTTAGGVTGSNTWKKLQFYARTVMPMWHYRITDLLRREYYRLVMPAFLAAESRSRREWHHFLDRHYRRKWNVRVSKVMDNATHVAMYFGFYLKKPPVAMSRLEHYAGRDEIVMRYHSHRTKKEETLTLSGDEFMERFSWHVPDKRFRMVRYYGFLSPSKRAVLDVVYLLTETARKTAQKVTWRGMYQRLLKVNPLACILWGENDVFQRADTGSASSRITGLPRTTGANENLLLIPGTGKVRPESIVCTKKRQ